MSSQNDSILATQVRIRITTSDGRRYYLTWVGSDQNPILGELRRDQDVLDVSAYGIKRQMPGRSSAELRVTGGEVRQFVIKRPESDEVKAARKLEYAKLIETLTEIRESLIWRTGSRHWRWVLDEGVVRALRAGQALPDATFEATRLAGGMVGQLARGIGLAVPASFTTGTLYGMPYRVTREAPAGSIAVEWYQ